MNLVTGATGLVGHAVCKQLVARGEPVRALVRSEARARAMLGEDIELVVGDVTEPASLAGAVAGCSTVFHAAGMPEQWARDERVFDRVNRQGTVNVLEACLAARVDKVVYTSTMDVFAAEPGGTLVETNVDAADKHTAYERSKQSAEREAERFLERGLAIVFVNPAAVYGPSPLLTGVNGAIARLLAGKVPMLPPGGMPLVHVDGVAAAHVAARDRGRAGERYLLGDAHATMRELAELVLAAEGQGRKVPRVAPRWLMRALVVTMTPLARLFRFTPLVAPGELTFLSWNVRVDAGKAQRELGFAPTSLREGIAETVAHLRQMR